MAELGISSLEGSASTLAIVAEAATALPVTASSPAPTPAPASSHPRLPVPRAKAEEDKPSSAKALPQVTRGSSDEYLRLAALATARASTSYEFTILMEKEKVAHVTSMPISSITIPDAEIIESARVAALGRLRRKISWGSFVVEAGWFAAVSCWEPLSIFGKEYVADMRGERAEEVRAAGRPLFAGFLDQIAVLQREFLEPAVRRMRRGTAFTAGTSSDGGGGGGGQEGERDGDGKFWQMSLVARDPTREYLPGAVRAVIVPLMDEVCSRQTKGGAAPIWLIAGGRKARDMYEHFGFKEVGEIDVSGLKLWGMLYTAGLNENLGEGEGAGVDVR